MLTPAQLNTYLAKINCGDMSREPTLENLSKLHENHLMTFSFGSASIQDKYFIPEDPNLWYEKLVIHNQCGVCYELNYNFHRLLVTLGYTTVLVQAQVCFPDPSLSPSHWRISAKFGHALNIVTINNIQYICDVGIIDSIRVPIQLKIDIIKQQDGLFELRLIGEYYFLIRTRNHKHAIVRIDPTPRLIEEFIHLVPFQNHNPRSLFQHQSFATKKDVNGYRMIKGSTYKILDNVHPENSVAKENLTIQECIDICQKDFGLQIQTYNYAQYVYEPDDNLEAIEIII